jgi:predicted MFS family arabinose efflux permease
VPRRGEATFVGDMLEGIAYALRTPAMRFILGLQIILSFCVFNFSVYVPLLARDVLGMGAEGFGLLMTCLGVGALAAGLSLGGMSALPPRLIASALAVACGGLVGLSLTRALWVAALLLALTGLSGTIVMAGCNTALQLGAPDGLRGRVMSLYSLLSGGIFPLGAFWVGFVSEHWGVQRAFLVNGAVGLLAVGALSLWRRLRAR